MNNELALENLRKKRLAELAQNPFQQTKFSKTTNVHSIIQQFSQFDKEQLAEKQKKVSLAGRMTRKRMIFADLTDQSGTIQLSFSNKKKEFAELDNGDIIGLKGIIFRTDTKELSVKVEEFILLSKCFKHLPSTYYGLEDTEERFRNRPLDFIINKEKKAIFFLRHKIIQNIRQFLQQREFIEIETPIFYKGKEASYYDPIICYDGEKAIHGFEITRLVDFGDEMLEARKQIDLSPRQRIIAEQSEIIVRSFAKVGIIYLTDEATGYQ